MLMQRSQQQDRRTSRFLSKIPFVEGRACVPLLWNPLAIEHVLYNENSRSQGLLQETWGGITYHGFMIYWLLRERLNQHEPKSTWKRQQDNERQVSCSIKKPRAAQFFSGKLGLPRLRAKDLDSRMSHHSSNTYPG